MYINITCYCFILLFIKHNFSASARLYIFEYKFNNAEDVNAVFENSTFGVIISWSGLVGNSVGRVAIVTENGPEIINHS